MEQEDFCLSLVFVDARRSLTGVTLSKEVVKNVFENTMTIKNCSQVMIIFCVKPRKDVRRTLSIIESFSNNHNIQTLWSMCQYHDKQVIDKC